MWKVAIGTAVTNHRASFCDMFSTISAHRKEEKEKLKGKGECKNASEEKENVVSL